MQAPNNQNALLPVFALLGLALFTQIARADCPELPPTDNVCINLETTADCGANCCTFNKDNRRTALIIGNNDYSGKLGNLCNAGFDARALALKLKGEDFNVCCLLNAKHRNIEGARIAATKYMRDVEAIKDADGNPRYLPRDTRFLTYFAGHGSFSTGQDDNGVPNQTLIFGTGKYETDEDLLDNATSITTLRDDWGSFQSVHPIIVVDACRTPITFPADLTSFEPRESVTSRTFSMAARSFKIPLTLKARGGGYVVLYSTKAGTIASDVFSGGAGSVQSGRFMRYFSDEIDAWGRKLDRIFDVVNVAVKKDSEAARPPDGQAPTEDDNSPLFNAWPWRISSDACSAAMNELGNAVESDGAGGSRCPDKPFSECLALGEPSPVQCATYNIQLASVKSDAACAAKVDHAFSAFFGANGDRCRNVSAEPEFVATNFTRDMTVADARLDQALTAPTTRGSILTEGAPEIPQIEKSVEVRTGTELRSPDRQRSAVEYAQKGTKLQIDCLSPGSSCSRDWIGVRSSSGQLSYVRRSAVRAVSSAKATVDLLFDKATGLPTISSLEALEKEAGQFIDKPETTVRITAEVSNGADPMAMAEAERQASQLEALIQAGGFKGQKFVRDYVVLAKDIEPSQIHLEFVAGQ
ncbi:caspase family protein [Hyphomicrobium facile]|uniref:Caspase domain-containing protein n=1 Tax=Hyphomicrobium facile TaxID=51670 RepID=A0A1I7NVJ9_9HYPH|nr:caspase family protein [Hyphomicrobium facile]SFV38695.1 Caspase domain-containing protein [Hyphomicrobium facile]